MKIEELTGYTRMLNVKPSGEWVGFPHKVIQIDRFNGKLAIADDFFGTSKVQRFSAEQIKSVRPIELN